MQIKLLFVGIFILVISFVSAQISPCHFGFYFPPPGGFNDPEWNIVGVCTSYLIWH